MGQPQGFLTAWMNDAEDGEEGLRLTPEQEDAINFWLSDVWNFCTGTWPLRATKTREARPIVWTQDKMAGEVRPFPHYPYLCDGLLRPVFMAPRRGPDGVPLRRRYVVPKPRQVFCTNALLAGCIWDVAAHEATEWLVARNTRPQAERFVKERVRFIIDHLPKFFRAWLQVKPKPAGRVTVARRSSHITAVSRNFGAGEALGDTTSVLMDEAPRLRGLRAVWLAADAQSPCIVAVSAPPERGVREIDPESVAFFRELWEGLDEGTLTRAVVRRGAPSTARFRDDEDEAAAAESAAVVSSEAAL